MNNEPSILIIEDDKNIQNFLSISLKTNGYRHETAATGLEGISLFLSNNPDLILLDLGLPDIDGLKVLEQIRSFSDVPVIVVSARGQEKEKVQALDMGADDYITKPFYINELLARIRVALRKHQPKVARNSVFTLDTLTIDFEKRKVFVEGKEVHLTPLNISCWCCWWTMPERCSHTASSTSRSGGTATWRNPSLCGYSWPTSAAKSRRIPPIPGIS